GVIGLSAELGCGRRNWLYSQAPALANNNTAILLVEAISSMRADIVQRLLGVGCRNSNKRDTTEKSNFVNLRCRHNYAVSYISSRVLPFVSRTAAHTKNSEIAAARVYRP